MSDQQKQSKPKSRPELEPALCDAETAASMLSLSVSMFHRLLSSGRIGFKKIKLAGKCSRYSVQEIRDWARAGGKSRVEWARMEMEDKA